MVNKFLYRTKTNFNIFFKKPNRSAYNQRIYVIYLRNAFCGK